MDQRHREILRLNHVYLVQNLDLKHGMLMEHLVQEHLLTDQDEQRLKASRDFCNLTLKVGTCEASRFDSNSNRTSRFDSIRK